MKNYLKNGAILATTAACLLALAACGSASGSAAGKPSSKPSAPAYASAAPDKIIADATTAMKSATSTHVTGNMTDKDGTFDVDLTFASNGDCAGTMNLNSAGAIKIVSVGGKYWLQGNEAFWKSQGADDTMSATAGKWVEASFMSGMIGGVCKPDSYLAMLGEPSKADASGIKVTAGDDTVTLTGIGGKTTSVIEVAESEPHYLTALSTAEDGKFTFSDFDKPLTVTPPSGDQVVQLP